MSAVPAVRPSYVLPAAGFLLSAALFVAATSAQAAQGPVGLGTAESFSVLAYSGITNTGATTIVGDVGTFPTTSESGFGSVTLIGTDHAGDAVTQGAKNDLTTAYNDAASRNPVTNLPVELGGSTLLAGVYASGTFGLTGTLTLDAQGNPNAQFIFKTASTLITASNSRVRLLGGADPCRVVWKVGSSATFDTGTRFVGDVLAYTSIQALTGATFQGRLLARNGAVTLDHNIITNATCNRPGPDVTVGPTPSATVSPPGVNATPTPSAAPAPGLISPPRSTPSPSVTASAAPGPGDSSDSSSGPPTGKQSGPPGGPPSETRTTPRIPFLPYTGLTALALAGVGLALLALGTVAAVTPRRRTCSRGTAPRP